MVVWPLTASAQCDGDPRPLVSAFRRDVSTAQRPSDLNAAYEQHVSRMSRGGLTQSEFVEAVNRLKRETVWDDARGREADVSIEKLQSGRTRASYSIVSKKYGRVQHDISLVCESGRWKVAEFRVTPSK